MNRKAKGTNGERELIHQLWAFGFAACRVAGSGSMHYPSPDIIAGKNGRILVIECKVTGASTQYFGYPEIHDFLSFAKIINAEPWIAVKFDREGWFFVICEDLADTGKYKALSLEVAKRRGLSFEELINH